MNKSVIKKRITVIMLATVMTITASAIIFQSDVVKAVATPKEVNTILKMPTGGLLSFSKNIEYVKSTLKGKDIDVYTIVKGEYKPVNLDYFLSLYKDDNGNYLTWKQISEPSKTIYAGMDTDENKVININLISGSMEPIVFESNKGNRIFIRFSNKFILDNGGTLSKGHELFESEYDISKDPDGIPKNLESIAYFKAASDKKDVKLIVESVVKNIESKPIKEIEDTMNHGGVVGSSSDVFNYSSQGNYVGEPSHDGIIGSGTEGISPGYATNSENDGTPIYSSGHANSSDDDKIDDKIDKEIDNPGGTGISLEEALLKQRQKANSSTGVTPGPGTTTDNDNGPKDKPVDKPSDKEDDKTVVIDYDSVDLSELDKITEESIKAKFGQDAYVIKTLDDLHKYQSEDSKMYGDHIVGALIKTLELNELEKLYEDAMTYKWSSLNLIAKLYQEKYSKKLEKELDPYTDTYDYSKYTGNGYKDYNYTEFKENADKYKDIDSQYDPIYDGTVDFKPRSDVDEFGNPRNTWRFKWGTAEKSNLNGYTNQNDLLLKGVYDYWEVNLMSPDMKKLDINKFRQVPSEQLLQLPIEFEPMQKSSSVLFKLSLFGLIASVNMLAVFIVSRKINQTKNMEKFSKNIVFKEEKLNLTSFEEDKFKLNI